MYQERVALQFSALDRKHLDALTGQRKKIPLVMPSFTDLILETLTTRKK